MTTGVPSSRVAAWTWAIDAAASGLWSILENTEPTGRASSSSITRWTTGQGSGRTWSRQRLNSSTSSDGKIPSPDEMICPSLM